jgi:hypothetical protein
LAKASTLVTFVCHCRRLFHLKNIANGNTALRNILKLFVGFIQDTNTKGKSHENLFDHLWSHDFWSKIILPKDIWLADIWSAYKDMILSFGRQTIG